MFSLYEDFKLNRNLSFTFIALNRSFEKRLLVCLLATLPFNRPIYAS